MASREIKVVKPYGGKFSGTISVPGDKSISHRAAIFASLASGQSVIENFLLSEDCLCTLKALEVLGVKVRRNGAKLVVEGTAGEFNKPDIQLDLGNSGTGMRLMAGLLAGQGFTAEITGDASLSSRPMRRIKEPLELMGAKVELLGHGGCAPIRVTGGSLKGIDYKMPVASAQVKSCILIAGLFAEGLTIVTEPGKTRDHTERMLRAVGADLRVDGLVIKLNRSAGKKLSLKSRNWNIPGDFSSAAFWITAAACRKGSELAVENVGLNPRRTGFLDVLKRMGANVQIAECGKEWEPVGTIRVNGGRLTGTEVGGDEIPNLIDEIPLVAVAGVLAQGKTIIRNAEELRVKESDRISSICAGLRAFGVNVEEKKDGMIISGGSAIMGGGEVDSIGDHRIAMAMSVLALFGTGPVTIGNTACVATSYPGFWDELGKLTAGRQ